MNELIDLRSDTITRPSKEMRAAMAAAEVGDDVFGEDPTVNDLQEYVAGMLGKEAALFVPTGVMANQLAIKCHTQPGEEIVVEEQSHIVLYETGAPALLSNVMVRSVHGERGILEAADVRKAVRQDIYYLPRTSLICLENTHNKAGGTIYPLERIRQIRAVSDSLNIPMHLDGARLWNASVASGIAPRDYANEFDSVSVCFSKGLGAPIGSAIAGSKKMIQKARKYRKIFGGGMRQVGILAAAARYAVDHNIERLAEDHEKARWFASAVADIPGFALDLNSVQTNIVIIDVSRAPMGTNEIMAKAKSVGVLISDMSVTALRAVTHMDVSMEQVKRAAQLLRTVLR